MRAVAAAISKEGMLGSGETYKWRAYCTKCGVGKKTRVVLCPACPRSS